MLLTVLLFSEFYANSLHSSTMVGMKSGPDFILNSAQKKVLDHKNGPLLVVAGAGTGKTRVIVEKINALLDSGVKPESILALTFTEKAAAEMLDRVLETRDQFMLELPVMTFNAYGGSLLQEFNVDIGLSRNHLLLGENAKIVFLRQNLSVLQLDYFSPLSNPEGLLPDVADYFSKLKQHLVTPKIYEAFVKEMPDSDDAQQLEKKKHSELAKAYKNYLELCKSKNVIDFDDQIYQVIQLLEARPNIRAGLQERYHTILVDEFQDTNPMQSRLIDLLANKAENLIVVGDDDQSIYGFRGATLANILDFKTRYPNTKEVALIENYRCAQTILDASYKLIQHNNPHRLESALGISKKLHGQFSGIDPKIREFNSLSTELQWISQDIKDRITKGQSPGSIAILCRRNRIIPQLHEALQLADVDHIVIGEKYQLYKTEVVRVMLEALRAIADSRASMNLYHTLAGPLFDIPNVQLSEHASKARYEKQYLEQYLSEQDDISCNQAISQIKQWREASAVLSVGRLLYKIIEESGFKDRLYAQALQNEEEALSVMQLSQFFRTLKEFESVAPMPTVTQYLDSFPVLEAAGETDEDSTLDISNEEVNVLTVHKSKGLEWQTVYIPDCTEGGFPIRKRSGGIPLPEQLIEVTSSEADEHVAEERRLMYVALTRAKEDVITSYSLKHHTPTPKKPSRFLNEIWNNPIPEKLPAAKATQYELASLAVAKTDRHTIRLPKSFYQSGTLRLSVSQISNFLECPLNFYYRYVLNVPELPNAAASYGTVIHEAIEQFNQAMSAGETMSLEMLQDTINKTWSNAGFLSLEHAEKSRAQALKTISDFYKTHQKNIPSKIEWPFSVHLEEPKLIITGRLDAVFEHNGSVEIRDYKTSTTVNNEKKAKQRAVSSNQLTLYALVWQALHGSLPTTLSLEFVDTGITGSVKKTQRGIDGMYTKLQEMMNAIEAGNYPARGEHTFCIHPSLQ